MEEGDPDLFFSDLGTSVGGEEDAAPIPLPEAVDDTINGMSEEVNTIEALQGVVDIDNDNEPAPKNVPRTPDNSNRLLSTEWGHDGFCFRRSQNMGTNFLPSWNNCIDESMSKWINKYTCPGFMYIPRKPWKFGKEYHDAGCSDSNIIWALDLREGKDWPQNLGHKEFDNIGKTIGILL